MRMTINTKWLGPTNHKGSRVKATDTWTGKCLIDSWDHATGVNENHCRVAKIHAASMGWTGLFVAGDAKDGNSYIGLPPGISPSSFAGHTLDRHPLGVEGRDWFYLEDREA